MRRVFPLILWQFGLLAGGRLFADVVTLKDGRQISGLVESGNIQELHIKVGDQSQTIDIHQVQAILFGVSLPAPPPPKAANLPAERAPAKSTDSKTPSLSHDAASLVLDGADVAATNAFKSAGLTGCGKVYGGVEWRGSAFRLTQPAFVSFKRGCQ